MLIAVFTLALCVCVRCLRGAFCHRTSWEYTCSSMFGVLMFFFPGGKAKHLLLLFWTFFSKAWSFWCDEKQTARNHRKCRTSCSDTMLKLHKSVCYICHLVLARNRWTSGVNWLNLEQSDAYCVEWQLQLGAFQEEVASGHSLVIELKLWLAQDAFVRVRCVGSHRCWSVPSGECLHSNSLHYKIWATKYPVVQNWVNGSSARADTTRWLNGIRNYHNENNGKSSPVSKCRHPILFHISTLSSPGATLQESIEIVFASSQFFQLCNNSLSRINPK